MSDHGDPIPECACDEDDREEQDTGRADLVMRVCRVCGRRHFEVSAEPLHVGVKPSD